jgi:hypothetical protein
MGGTHSDPAPATVNQSLTVGSHILDPHGHGRAMTIKHPEIRVTLDAAGDDFRIVDHVSRAMRRAGIPADEIEQFCDEALSGKERDLLRICGRWVTLAPH